MAYRITINTDNYVDLVFPDSKRNKTLNNFMHAINGVVFRENNLKDLKRRIQYFAGNLDVSIPENKYWVKNKKVNKKISFYDECNEQTVSYEPNICFCCAPELVGCHFSIEDSIVEMRKTGRVEIPLYWFYIRSVRKTLPFVRSISNCYMVIEKI